jgi:predicted ATPase
MGALGVQERDSQDEARRRLSELLASLGGPHVAEDELICDGLAPLLGLRAAEAGIQETYWAVRKFLERLARRRPVVVVFDDVHWARPRSSTLLDYLGDWMQVCAGLVVCQRAPSCSTPAPVG